MLPVTNSVLNKSKVLKNSSKLIFDKAFDFNIFKNLIEIVNTTVIGNSFHRWLSIFN